MMKKFTTAALSLAIAFSATAGIANLNASADETASTPMIAKVVGESGKVTENEWKAIDGVALSGENGTVKVATVGSNLFFRVEVTDTTFFSGKERIAWEISVGTLSISTQGNFDPWLTGTNPDVVTEMSYDETNTKAIATMGYSLGENYAEGATATMSFTYQDAATADTTWGHGTATTWSGTMTFASTVTEPIAPENPDLGIVVVDLPSAPTEDDWANATAYEMGTVTEGTTGATGTIKIYTAASNFFVRMEINDPTSNVQNDGVYFYFGTEDYNYEARGNYKNWLADINKDFVGSPSLLVNKTTATKPEEWEPGVMTFDIGYHIPDIYAVGGTMRICAKHRDSQSAAEGWKDGDYTHTLVFDQIVTFGEAADLTVRPEEATEGFTGSASDISYNKANICWNEVTGAETYKMFVYAVNAEGSEEPYEHLSVEGPIYAGTENYAEEISGLSATTAYVVQIIAYDANESVIACSELVEFSTISREEALNPTPNPGDGNNDSSSTPDAPADDNSSSSSSSTDDGATEAPAGCFGVVGSGLSVLALAGVAFVALKKKED